MDIKTVKGLMVTPQSKDATLNEETNDTDDDA
jgi:hypothetical protein